MADLTMVAVENWIRYIATGDFYYKEVLGGNINPKLWAKLREYIGRCCEKELCETLGRRDGWYRPISDIPKPVNWQDVEISKDFPIILPFDLRKYVWIDPETSIVIAGSKDASKTGFILRTIALNIGLVKLGYHIELLSNLEGGINKLKRRFNAMDIKIPNPAPFTVRHIIDNFHDAIKEPNTLYLIDYIDVPESGEFYMIAPALAKIQVKLKNSVAVIALQKKTTSDKAYGGEQTMKKADLYLSLDRHRLKIVRAKVPADPQVDPVNKQWTFNYSIEGENYTDIKPYYGDNEEF